MKKSFLLFIAFVFNSVLLYSQSISVELSIHWEIDSISYPLSEENPYVPFLDITYRNNSNEDVYFLKVSPSLNGCPTFLRSVSLVHPQDYSRKKVFSELVRSKDYIINSSLLSNYSDDHFTVIMGTSPFYCSKLELLPDTLDPNEGHMIAEINDDLSDIYGLISTSYSYSVNAGNIYYSTSDITENGVSNEIKNKFVFLRQGEIYSEKYNLIGFKLLKGHFTFYANGDFPSYVYTSNIWDKKQQKFFNIQTLLPRLIGVYKLYSGHFYSNKITISF